MKDKSKIVSGPRQNEQNDPVYCSECGKQTKGNQEEEGCICPVTDTQKGQPKKIIAAGRRAAGKG